MLIYRASAAISVNYWVLGHTGGFLVFGIMLIESLLNMMYTLYDYRVPLKKGDFTWDRNTFLSVCGICALMGTFLTDMFLANIGQGQKC